MNGLTVVFACMCSDAAMDPDDPPERCPGHQRPRVGQWRNIRGALRTGHDCPTDHPCPTRKDTT